MQIRIRKNIIGANLFLVCSLLLFGCKKDPKLIGIEPVFGFEKPAHFPDPTYSFDNNPVTKEGFYLGKKLFFDPVLSVDNSVSCSSCHLQSLAFADSPVHPVSFGVDNRAGKRNAPPIQNMAFMESFAWDGGIHHLDFVALNAITLEFEMDEGIANVVAKLNDHEDYPGLFKGAFGVDSVTSPFLLYALSQFENMLVSDNSKYDHYLNGEANLSVEELAGMDLFNAKCEVCHSGVLFTDQSFHNNGILTEFPLDSGRAAITESSHDVGKFRTPSLRNVARTAPYMHDGSIETLEEVLEHYNSGVKASSTLDPRLSEGIALSEDEQQKIIAFLKTLTDTDFITNPLFFNED